VKSCNPVLGAGLAALTVVLFVETASAQYGGHVAPGPQITAYFQHAACHETDRDWHCDTKTYSNLSADGKSCKYYHSGLDEGIACTNETTKQVIQDGKAKTVRDQCLAYGSYNIFAAADGYVVFTKEDCPDTCGTGTCYCPGQNVRGIGNQVRLVDRFGRLLSFGHMRAWSIPDAIIDGARVKCGDTLGEIGSSGNSTGPHLHFEVGYFRNEPADPHTAIGGAVDPFASVWSPTRGGYCSDEWQVPHFLDTFSGFVF